MNLLYAIVVAITLLVVTPSTAEAHLVTTGLGPFYDGMMHLLLSPGDLLGLAAASLLAGLCGTRVSRLAVLALPMTWLTFGLVGLYLPNTIDLAWLSILLLIILGLLVALDLKLPPPAVTTLAGIYGALQGLLNGSALAVIGAGPLSLLGIVVTVLVIALLVSAIVVSLRAAWTRIVVRVAGSWVAAVGLLMFGWLVRGTS
jgi:hydrogenase/urease accessory protein HupE